MDYRLVKENNYCFKVQKTKDMNVPLIIFASEKLISSIKEDGALEQGINVAKLPGIVKHSIMMSDAHKGYGFSIGGVAAFDVEQGIITPGGIGFDINCGVRLLKTNLTREDVEPKIHELLDRLFEYVPSGVGKDSNLKLSHDELDKVIHEGARWAVRKGFGNEEDLEFAEEHGSMPGAKPGLISPRAKKRGKAQLGTLGAGNHFLEVQIVDQIFNERIAEAFGLKQGQVVIMIHCGSRGLGHQVCSDYLRKMEDEFPGVIENLPEKDLIYAPFKSKLGQDYYSAMIGAANFAWANRHIIGHYVRKAFTEMFVGAEVRTLYDVAHNIAKLEKHTVEGIDRELIVHRKGATRAFGPGREEIPKAYREIGQPILLPGSMGTSSYVLVGTEEGMQLSFGSTAHGAGRAMSRIKALKAFNADKVRQELQKNKIYVKSASKKGIAEEAPLAYKDVDEVVRVSNEAGIGKLVVKLKPLGVIKG